MTKKCSENKILNVALKEVQTFGIQPVMKNLAQQAKYC